MLALFFLAFVGVIVRAAYLQGIDSQRYVKLGEDRQVVNIPEHAQRGRILDRNGVELATNRVVFNIWGDFYYIPVQARGSLAAALGIPLQELEAKIPVTRDVPLRRGVEDKLARQVAALGIPGVSVRRTADSSASSTVTDPVPAAPTFDIGVDSNVLSKKKEDIYPLAATLELSAKVVEDRISSIRATSLLARGVDITVSERVKELCRTWVAPTLDAKGRRSQGIRGIYQERIEKRVYPEDTLFAQVVGFVAGAKAGVEQAFDQTLSGRDGWREGIRDGSGHLVEERGPGRPKQDGQDVVLSLDRRIQHLAFEEVGRAMREHKANFGSAVVLDVQSGEILALVSAPSFSPAQIANLEEGRDHALTEAFEPGSTIKPIVVAQAMEKKLVAPYTTFSTMSYRIGSTTITDSHPAPKMTVSQIIQKSSNVGVTKIALKLDPVDMWALFDQLGFGRKPTVPFPGASWGTLRPNKPLRWRPIEQASMSFGYGLSVSLLQLARAYTVFADGTMPSMSLLRVKDPQTVDRTPVLGAKVAAEMRKMLRLVTAEGGTAPHAQVRGYSVGGKTGTARKYRGGESGGYRDKKHRSLFVGLAPIEAPRIVVAVLVDEPSAGHYYGGDVAAPVFARVAAGTLQALGVAPDANVVPHFVTDMVLEDE
ncbi:cell division protein FtsI [Candidatus Symbiobacter mobilis CR]|uniref:Cell division protein FtsI n=1 Tax=Candidatus Symbiobacter mobilis CR TaxID=946483 RepID=U5N658_9BURK|nr:cell division protein FtsI [Candidatus Symbiobacter mobilis CR]